MTAIVALLNRIGDGAIELQFVRHNASGIVHVVWPDDPDEVPRRVSAAEFVNAVVSPMRTVCGYPARRDGTGGLPNGIDEMVSVFPDEALCAQCWRLLGPWQEKAFEHATERTDWTEWCG